jgi:hypothetical protein
MCGNTKYPAKLGHKIPGRHSYTCKNSDQMGHEDRHIPAWMQPSVKQMSLWLEAGFLQGSLLPASERAAGKEGRASGGWGGGLLISSLQSNSYVNMPNRNPGLTLSMLI